MPLALSDDSEPEPDLAVVAGDARVYMKEHPTTALLVVEVADSSLAFDRQRKGRIYAAAAIPEYWIVNLAERVLEVYRMPAVAGSGGFEYTQRTTLDDRSRVSPLARPDTSIAVANLLP
jgi:Uma2 family endonuclease